MTVTSPKIACSSLLTCDHRKKNPNRINDLAELFSVGRTTVYRTLQRNGGR